MKRGTEKILLCPKCKSSLIILSAVEHETFSEVRAGKLECKGCGSFFPIRNGIVYTINKLPTKVQREIRQWEIFADSEGWLNPPDEYLDSLPSPEALKYVPGDTITWHRHEANFHIALEGIPLQGKKLLDLGAGRCWSTKHLSLRGAKCYALDVLDHPKIGLGAADILMSRNGIFFERFVADMNEIPFQDGSFDIVFCSGALHHTLNLKRTISEISRVLKKSGVLILTNEACGGLKAQEECYMTGIQFGINEHNYVTLRYLTYLIRSGFRLVDLIPSFGFFNPRDAYFGGTRWTRLVAFHRLFYYVFLVRFGGVLVLRARKRLCNE